MAAGHRVAHRAHYSPSTGLHTATPLSTRLSPRPGQSACCLLLFWRSPLGEDRSVAECLACWTQAQ